MILRGQREKTLFHRRLIISLHEFSAVQRIGLSPLLSCRSRQPCSSRLGGNSCGLWLTQYHIAMPRAAGQGQHIISQHCNCVVSGKCGQSKKFVQCREIRLFIAMGEKVKCWFRTRRSVFSSRSATWKSIFSYRPLIGQSLKAKICKPRTTQDTTSLCQTER